MLIDLFYLDLLPMTVEDLIFGHKNVTSDFRDYFNFMQLFLQRTSDGGNGSHNV